ncbi:energy transducer TonB [Hymenobacter arizonensis]|nr:hypothetical protein [Hymenobacter arizonensis]
MGLACEASAQRRTTPSPRGKTAKTAQAVPPPAAPAGMMPLLPRFWQLTDSAERTDAAEVFTQYLRHFISYPTLALQAGLGGTIYARLTVQPDGRVSGISITRRDLSTNSPPIKAVMALDAELQRVAWKLRFKPAQPRTDSTSRTIIASSTSVSADSLENIDITDSATASTDSTDVMDITDVTDEGDAAQPKLEVDTVTIYHRFVPLKEGQGSSSKHYPNHAGPPPKYEAKATRSIIISGRGIITALL